MRMFYCFNWSWSWSWVKKSQLTKSFSWKDCSFCFSINLYVKFTLMKNKKWTGIVILFHQIFTFMNFTHLEFFKQCFLKLSVLYKTGKSEVRLETFKNESLISWSFFLINYREVFVDLTVIALHFYRTEFSGFSFTLFLKKFLFVTFEFEISQRTESSFIVSYSLHSFSIY